METKKLTCCDIMIGDWVLYDPNVFIEDEYEPHKEPYPCRIESGEQIDDAVNECYSPIPLTAEVLGKNGYASYEEDKNSFHDKSCVFIKQKDGGYGVCIDNVRTISGVIHYIHELQHALRLCGINDKEIVL